MRALWYFSILPRTHTSCKSTSHRNIFVITIKGRRCFIKRVLSCLGCGSTRLTRIGWACTEPTACNLAGSTIVSFVFLASSLLHQSSWDCRGCGRNVHTFHAMHQMLTKMVEMFYWRLSTNESHILKIKCIFYQCSKAVAIGFHSISLPASRNILDLYFALIMRHKVLLLAQCLRDGSKPPSNTRLYHSARNLVASAASKPECRVKPCTLFWIFIGGRSATACCSIWCTAISTKSSSWNRPLWPSTAPTWNPRTRLSWGYLRSQRCRIRVNAPRQWRSTLRTNRRYVASNHRLRVWSPMLQRVNVQELLYAVLVEHSSYLSWRGFLPGVNESCFYTWW